MCADPARLNDQLQNLGGIISGGSLDIINAQVTSLTSNGQKALGAIAFTVIALPCRWS
jgi:hypothetical protein